MQPRPAADMTQSLAYGNDDAVVRYGRMTNAILVSARQGCNGNLGDFLIFV
jgi:hypothetical protein